jgi:4-hydroxy-3-polyprenylbenzoate decarboxylase
MGYRNLSKCIADLEKNGHLLRIEQEIDADLEAAEIQRRVYLSGGPALFFTNVKGRSFPMASNIFGTLERARFIFRDTFENVQRAIQLKVEPEAALKNPLKYWRAPFIALQMRPKAVRRGAVMANTTTLSKLPQLKSWPDDGGAFVTLPQVYSEDAGDPSLSKSNMGMYRVQYSGNRFEVDRQVGIHYQIHRGIGVHHKAAIDAGKPFRQPESASIYADADFCISGTIDPTRQMPEGPFGDHLGYYSLKHDFPVLNVDKVYHRDGAIWPFTVVGRPPQEDTVFGELIHELTGPVIPTVLPGIKAVNAVDASGVHPLLLAIGSERYVPYQKTQQPQELLTQANAILGQGQMSLAKFLWIIDEAAAPQLNIDDIESFFIHCLKRVDWTRDLHFQTRTTIDTLDYSGSGFNEGSKVVVAAAGPAIREFPSDLRLPAGFSNPQICLPGVLAVNSPKFQRSGSTDTAAREFCNAISPQEVINRFPLILLVDDAEFTSRTLNNFLWTVFTRSNPAVDIDGIGATTQHKHWGCSGSLVIDARIKPHHAPPLIEDPAITSKVDALAARGGDLAKYL